MLNNWKPRILVFSQPTQITLNGKHLHVLNYQFNSLSIYYMPELEPKTLHIRLLNPYKKLRSKSLLRFHFAEEA